MKTKTAKTTTETTTTPTETTTTQTTETTIQLETAKKKSGQPTLASFLGINVPKELRGTEVDIKVRVQRALIEADKRLTAKGLAPLEYDESGKVHGPSGLIRQGYRPVAWSPAVQGTGTLLGVPVVIILTDPPEGGTAETDEFIV